MNYGIGKMRPCGHSHINKYAHAAVYQDVERINREFYYDLTSEGEWIYPFEKLSNWRDYISSYGGPWFKAGQRLKKWHIPFPEKLSLVGHAFTGCGNLVDLNLLCKSKSTNAAFLIIVHGGTNNDFRKYHFKLPHCGGALYRSSNSSFGEGSEYKVYAPYIHTLEGNLQPECSPFFSQLDGKSTVDVYAPNVQDLNFGYMYLTEVTYNVDEGGNPSFWTGNETVGTEYNVFPKLKKGTNAFSYGQLNKPYTKAFLEALPLYTDGKENHPLTIGIHIDHCYDEDINRLLKLTDKEWVENHAVDIDDDTDDKGWKLDVRWNGTPTDKETLFGSNEPTRPSFIEQNIELPDGYTRCEYLEDNGTQWIDTGYVPKVTTSTDSNGNTIYTATTGLYAVAKQITHAGDVRFFGSGHELNNNNGFTAPRWLKSTGNSCGFAWKTWNSYGTIGNGSAFESKLNFLQSGTANLVTNYGKSYSNTLNANLGFSPTLSLYLFSTNVNNTSPSNRRWYGRIYRAKISEGTEIVRDFVPCLDANGVPCMYDVLESNGSVEADTYYNANPDSTFLYKLLES